MARTCIICGDPAGSREHIFPAALGGRRTNKGIYCDTHNNAYYSLAGIISEQISLFNAQLGVIGDHASEPRPVTMTDAASGKDIELTNSKIRFKGPRVTSEEVVDGGTVTQISFNNQKEADDWVRDQKNKGNDVQIQIIGRKTSYYLGTLHKQLTLGGNNEGLRAIGYIAQTFLAHSFPDVARLPELQGIRNYTLEGVGDGFVWWDFDPPIDLPENKFPFGHRIIVGVNKDNETCYARISLFSTLNFAIQLGTVPVEMSRSVITDIDPLAKSPPNDIVTWVEEAAKDAVIKPDNLSASLADAIGSGKAAALIGNLMRRIEDFELSTAAQEILKKVANAAALSSTDQDKFFTDVVKAEAQRVYRLIRALAHNRRNSATNVFQQAMADFLEKLIEPDPASANGLSPQAARSLDIACEALAKRMVTDFKDGVLDQDRMEMIIGGGVGMYTVGTALFQGFGSG